MALGGPQEQQKPNMLVYVCVFTEENAADNDSLLSGCQIKAGV